MLTFLEQRDPFRVDTQRDLRSSLSRWLSCAAFHNSEAFAERENASTKNGESCFASVSPIVIATTKNLKAKFQNWSNEEQTWGQLRDRYRNYDRWAFANEKNDAPAFCGVKLFGDKRENRNVEAVYLLIGDHDDGLTMRESAVIAQHHGLETIIYPSFNFNAITVDILHDDYVKWAQTNGKPTEITEALGREYLETTGKLLPKFAQAATYDGAGKQHTEAGFIYRFVTPPREKHRCVRPMANPVLIASYVVGGTTHKQVIDAFKDAMRDALGSLGGTFDPACADLARAYYEPVQRSTVGEDLPPPLYVEGQGFEFEPFLVAALARLKEGKSKTSNAKKGNSGPTSTGDAGHFFVDGLNLKVWAAQYARSFQIEALMEARGLVIGPREQGGAFVECFQEESHTPDSRRTFVVDSTPEKGFVLHCSGGTNGCNELDRLARLKGYIAAKKLSVDDLQNSEFGGGPISARVYNEERRTRERDDLRVVDRNGQGMDVGIFHASVIAKPGLFDFTLLNQTCGTQIAKDVTAEQLAGFIEDGRILVSDLTACALPAQDTAATDDPYRDALKDLAGRLNKGSVLGRDLEKALQAIKNEYGVKQKTIDADFRRISNEENMASEIPGVLSAQDSALVRPLRNYARDFAILNTGGKGVVLSLKSPDLSKAVMAEKDFEFLHRNEWFEIDTDQGIETIYPAKEFLKKPPRGCQVYRGGLVFKPSGTVGPDEYNLYQGMLIEPNPSGSYELMKELIRDVWVQGDEASYQWVLEFLMHIIAHPGEKVGTSLAIRGAYGDGKSIVTEKLMSSILGDMLLRVANQRLILGDFNEAIIGKLLIVLEEAAFAGDKSAFDRMKEQVTGDKIVINPKFKAPITVDNHARMIVVSNHEHFMHLKPGDRRYTVLESSPAWNGTKKFEELLRQWNDGGAARFVYDSLNHSFRVFDDRQRLVINSNLRTKAAVRQMAHSRSALEKCIATFLLRGDFTSVKQLGFAGDTQDGGSGPLWSLDDKLSIPSLQLQDNVTAWLRDYDLKAMHHAATLHTIVRTLEKFVGPTQEARPKVRDGKTWSQSPTERVLPTRRHALEFALGEGLITAEEYSASLG